VQSSLAKPAGFSPEATVSNHSSRPVRRRIALAILPLVALACSHDLLAPAVPRAGPGAPDLAIAATSRPKLVRNAVKYRDAGVRPSTGRSGTATLAARAMVGKDGVTELELTTGVFDPVPMATLPLTRALVKQFDAAGRMLRTYSHNGLGGGSASFRYPGLPRGARLEVQGNVTEGRRTDVVTVTTSVYRRPDLQVRLEAPETVRPGFPVNFVATVREENGDLGARADCVLYVDGAEADRVRGLWVDAGDAVSCAFTYAFASPGYRRVRVEAARVSPADFDADNNAAGATVLVDPNEFGVTAIAEDYAESTVQKDSSRATYDRGPALEQQSMTFVRYARQSAALYALFRHGVSFEAVRVRVSQSTGGVVVHAGAWPDAVEGYPLLAAQPGCASGWNAGVMLYLCSAGSADAGVTTVQYIRSGSLVTYFGAQHLRRWFPGAPDDVYATESAWNDAQGSPQVAMGPDYAFSVELADGGRTYRMNATVPLGAEQAAMWTYYPPAGTSCSTQYYTDPRFRWDICRYHRGEVTWRRGHAFGQVE